MRGGAREGSSEGKLDFGGASRYLGDIMTRPAEVARVLESIAREAGALLSSRFGDVRRVEKKGSIDLVTDVDRESETLVLARLRERFPNARVLAEESGASGTEDELRFYVDPLDGTTNFAAGLPHFAVTLAAEDALGLCAGVVFDPMRNEMYVASRQGGATCNGKRLSVSSDVELDDAVLATGLPYDVRTRQDDVLGLFADFVRAGRAVRRFGSAALDLAWTAQGRYDGYWERGLKPWDLAAGALLVIEAGGACVDYAGDALVLARGECVAASRSLADQMLVLTGRIAGEPSPD